jgi:aminoglycoside phosphotransferase (APT) family kinase protein
VLTPTSAELEPGIADTLASIRTARTSGPYRVRPIAEIGACLADFLRKQDIAGPRIRDLKRMGGGASKEQFSFTLERDDAAPRRCVLRMDPLEAAVLTSRAREFEILSAMHGVVPVPEALFVDVDGSAIGRPALITSFVDGVTKPTSVQSNVSGFGTVLGKELRDALKIPFIRHLAAIHALDWRKAELPSFQAPVADAKQAARWQVGWWTQVWRADALTAIPLLALVEVWLRENLPAARDLVLVHSDYRTGNYLFDEGRREITAILDWELAHVGDFHQDLAWIAIKSWSHVEDGVLLASGLMSEAELCDRYAKATGRTVDRRSLHFYQVLGLYQCVVICLGTSLRAAHEAHNHQDVLLTWLAAAGHAFLLDLVELMEQGGPR